MTILHQPRYMAEFACAGEACIDNCCHGWRVTIDPASERRYRGLADRKLRDAISANLVREAVRSKGRTKGGGRDKITYMRLAPDGRCPMQRGDGLCRIQSEIGEDALSHTCKTYPRIDETRDGVWSRSATMSCPEIALRLIEDGGALAPVETEVVANVPAARKPVPGTLSGEAAHLVRRTMLGILTAARQPWAGRVLLAALFAQDLSALDLKRDPDGIFALAVRYDHVWRSVDLEGEAAAPDALFAVFATIVREVYGIKAGNTIRPGRGFAMMTEAIGGLGGDLGQAFATFERVRDGIVAEERVRRPNLYANVLGNALLQNRFPPKRPADCFDAFAFAAIYLGTWRVLTAGLLARPEAGPFVDEARRAAYLLARSMMHNATLIDNVAKRLKAVGKHDPATIVQLCC